MKCFAVDLCICFMCVRVFIPSGFLANLLTTSGTCGGVGKMSPQKAAAHTNTQMAVMACPILSMSVYVLSQFCVHGKETLGYSVKWAVLLSSVFGI